MALGGAAIKLIQLACDVDGLAAALCKLADERSPHFVGDRAVPCDCIGAHDNQVAGGHEFPYRRVCDISNRHMEFLKDFRRDARFTQRPRFSAGQAEFAPLARRRSKDAHERA